VESLEEVGGGARGDESVEVASDDDVGLMEERANDL